MQMADFEGSIFNIDFNACATALKYSFVSSIPGDNTEKEAYALYVNP